MRDLSSVVRTLSERTHTGIPGVAHIESGAPGPVVGITVGTHGNEPAGLAAAEYLLRPGFTLLKGSLFVVLNNIKATQAYKEADTEEARRTTRFVDINLNRLPDSLFEDNTEARYEILRARELLPVWEQFEIGLDIHSTSQDSEPMLIGVGDHLPNDLIRGFPITKVITNITSVMRDRSVSEFYGTKERPCRSFGIECGGHEHTDSFDRAVICVQALLQNLGMVEGEPIHIPSAHEEYTVQSSMYFPNESYRLTKVFENFEAVSAGTVLAKGDGPDIVALEDGHTLFAPKDTKPKHLTEEVLFLTKPVQAYR